MNNVDPNGLYCLTGTVDGPGTACRGIGDTASAIGKDALQGGKEGFGDGAAIGAGLGCTIGFVGSIGSRTRAADQCAQDGKFLGFAGSIIGGGVGTVGAQHSVIDNEPKVGWPISSRFDLTAWASDIVLRPDPLLQLFFVRRFGNSVGFERIIWYRLDHSIASPLARNFHGSCPRSVGAWQRV